MAKKISDIKTFTVDDVTRWFGVNDEVAVKVIAILHAAGMIVTGERLRRVIPRNSKYCSYLVSTYRLRSASA